MIILAPIARFLLRLAGWRVEGKLPDHKKAVIIGAYHTSNWDGVLLIIGGIALGRRIHWLGKHTLFKGLAGPFVRLLGGVPVDRTASHGAVEQVVDTYNERDEMLLALAPEGTRRKVARWKRGFYYIAMGAGVPLILGAPDYPTKRVIIGPTIYPTGDIEADMIRIRAFYETTTPKFPEKAGPAMVGSTSRNDVPTVD